MTITKTKTLLIRFHEIIAALKFKKTLKPTNFLRWCGFLFGLLLSIAAKGQESCNNPVQLNVAENWSDCNSVLVDEFRNRDDQYNSTCGAADDRMYWACFTASSNETNIAIHGLKDHPNRGKIRILEGNCDNLNTIICEDAPTNIQFEYSPYETTINTVIGNTYYIWLSNYDEGQLCVFNNYDNPIDLPDEPYCNDDLSFENNSLDGWVITYGERGCGFMGAWDLPNIGPEPSRVALTSMEPDPILGRFVMQVPPEGGQGALRLGTVATTEGQTQAGAAEARSCFTVSPENASFGYMYATIIDFSGHTPEEQPMVHFFITESATGDTVPCGDFQIFEGNGWSNFETTMLDDGNDGIIYTPWQKVALDLSGYINQEVCLNIKVKDCNGGNGDCGNGSHFAYTYFDVFCGPTDIEVPSFCAGDDQIELCAPEGYLDYQWVNGLGMQPPLNERCVTINNPVGGTEYEVTMTSVTGCPVSRTVIINPMPVILPDNPTTCPGEPIDLVVTPTSNNGPYTFQWSHDGSTDASVTVNPNVSTTYEVTVTNASGCSNVFNITVNIDQCAPTVVLNTTPACNGNCGTLEATASGGSPPYNFTWSDLGLQGPGPHEVCPDTTTTYTVIINDANGFSDDTSAVLIIHPRPEVDININNPVSAGTCDGELIATISNGSAPFTLNWDNGSSDDTISMLCSGSYCLNVTDVNNCSTEACIDLNSFAINLIGNDPLCPGSCDGSVQLTVGPGAEPPLTFVWNNGSTDEDLSGLCPGLYFVTVMDANGIQDTASVIINEPDSLSLQLNSTDLTCFGAQNGSAEVRFEGGTAPYIVNWNNGSNTPVIDGLAPGNYCVTISDAQGCEIDSCVIINEPPAIEYEISSSPAFCKQANGSIIIENITGGTPNYQIQWDVNTNNQQGNTADNLNAGTYCAVIIDSLGCEQQACGEVLQQTDLVIKLISKQDVRCFQNCNGRIEISASGGLTPYTYLWNNNQNDSLIENLCAGSYEVIVEDASGCIQRLATTIEEPEELALVAYGDSICAGDTATILVNASGGESPYTYDWNNGLPNVSTHSVTPTTPTNYEVTVTDINNCSKTVQTSVTIINETVIVDAGEDQMICKDSCIWLNGTQEGGIAFDWQPTIGLNDPDSLNTRTCPELSMTYVLTVEGVCGNTFTDSVEITIAPDPIVQLPNDTIICQGNCLTIIPNTSSDVRYNWSPSSPTPNQSQQLTVCPTQDMTYLLEVSNQAGCIAQDSINVVVSNIFAEANAIPNFILEGEMIQLEAITNGEHITWIEKNDIDTIYTGPFVPTVSNTPLISNHFLLITENVHGCIDTAFTEVIVAALPKIPNVFTPNGDGINDTWLITNIENFPEATIRVYNRWGNIVYNHGKGVYKGNWSGNSGRRGKALPVGTYYFHINLNFRDLKYGGDVTILR